MIDNNDARTTKPMKSRPQNNGMTKLWSKQTIGNKETRTAKQRKRPQNNHGTNDSNKYKCFVRQLVGLK